MTHFAAIHEFVEPVPVCLHTAAFLEAIELFDRNSVDRIVVINEQQFPIGLLQARRLLSQVRSDAPISEFIEALPFLRVTDAIAVINWSQSAARFWAALDDDRQFLGLVDSFYLRKFAALETPVPQRQPTSETLWHHARKEVIADPVPPAIGVAQLQQQLQLQIVDLNYEQSANLQPNELAVRSLMQILERLPLPLMLQTQSGEVIAQNELWKRQFGDLSDTTWLHRDAASVLETGIPATRTPLSEVLHPMCQMGSSPNTCVCSYPLKNGQEKIVQLVTIPLGSLFTGDEAYPSFEQSFRLADFAESPRSHLHFNRDLWLVLAQDVTEQQQLARELAAKNADLVQLNRLKDEFLACISHELRTPLTAVLGLSSLLKDQRSGTMNERQVRYAQLIYRSGRHLMAIVNDILDLTRIETGQLELTFYPVNIRSACDRAFEQACQLCLEEEKPEKDSEIDASAILPRFSLEIEPGLETLVADEMRLRQMLVHLLSNALKFTDSNGKIGLNVNRWEGWIAFTVWDNGIGIPAEKQHLIFQKFQQLESPLTRRFEGAGLGLVLTQRLARLHGGDISFVSREHQGSQFTLLLPPTHPQQTHSIAVPIQRTNRLVLIVEAVVRSIEHLSEQLIEIGYRVVIARSGTEAVEKARRLQPFAVLLNPLLPTLSGWDVLTLLKADPQTHDLPVIITGTRGDREQASRNQADGFLSLPIVQKSLQQVLRQLTVDEEMPIAIAEPAAASQVVLRLSPTRYGELRRAGNGDVIDVNLLLHQQNYRVLEADDLEQAELLAQVWKPNVVLLDSAVPDASTYLRLLSECSFLASLPLVTMDLETTQAANQIPGLSVFPCLAPLIDPALSTAQSETSALLQVIQVASGFAWRPFVLAVDSTKLRFPNSKRDDWLEAAMQYLQTAGFRGILARSWQDVLQKLDTQSIDLLLLHASDLDEPTIQQISTLKQFREKVAIVIINHQPENTALLEAISTVVLPPMPMEELLDRVNHILEA